MKTTRRNDLSILLTLLLAGCAASAISEDEDGAIPFEDQGEDDAGSDGEPMRDAGAAAPKDAGGPKVTTPVPDAGKPIADAGHSSGPDAAVSKPDASAPRVDAPTPMPPVTPTDAGTKPPGAPPDAAVPTNPNSGNTCKKDSDCVQSCLPIGVATCCRDDQTCGCTWTPGIYCL